MKPIAHADLVALLRPHDPPCVSLHVAVDARDGGGPAAVKLANLARSIRPQVESWPVGAPAPGASAPGAPAETLRVLDEMVHRLSEQPWEPADGAWRAPTRGLALFASPTFSALHRLTSGPADFTAVESAFHARPVLEQHACDMQFHLLAIHKEEVRLFEGCAERLDALPLGDIPATLEQAVGRAWDDSQQGRGFHGSPAAGKGRGTPQAAGVHFHGFGGSDRDEEKERARFLLRIGHGLPRGIGDVGAPPLVVMTTDKMLGSFKKLHPNVQIAEGGIALDPAAKTTEELHARAWAALEPVRARRIATALESIEASIPRARASKDLVTIAQAAVNGRVGVLVLAQGKRDAGRLDEATGDLRLDGPGHDGADVLEQIAAAVLLNRGDVLVAPPEKLRSHAGAIFRY